jgi:peroxisomal enoyl-CoA hydratase 2
MNLERFPVEAGAIRVWAHAIDDENPLYFDESAAAAAGLRAIAAPPTFVQAVEHWVAQSQVRPTRSQVWRGSGRTPGIEPQGQDGRLHAEQHFEYHRPVVAGDVLSVRSVDGESWHKRGRRGGTLRFDESVTEYRDPAGELVVTVRSVAVLTEHTPTDAAPAPARATPPPMPAAAPRPAIERLVVDDLKRTQIVQYAGASGDFNPVHTDEIYAVQVAGFPSVFAHGMLTMALTGKLLTDVVGIEHLVRFGGRFLAQVWPGDSLMARLEPAADTHADTFDVSLHTVNQDGLEVFAGTATARRAAPAAPAAPPRPPTKR